MEGEEFEDFRREGEEPNGVDDLCL